jgi:hypothetical protein
MNWKIMKPIVILVVVLAAPSRGFAHHEAVFGPQSALVMTAPSFVSVQTYIRRTGTAGNRARESTGIVSAGVAPFSRIPLSFTAIVPASRISDLESSRAFTGREDVILGARYHFDFPGLNQRFGKEGNFAMVMGAAEIPSGNVDHAAFDAPMDYMLAGLGSIEKGPFSGIGYAFGRIHGSSLGDRAGNLLFLGGGLAWTPLDNPSSERLLSFQAGISHERYARDVVGGRPDPSSGGSGTLIHPTVVWGPGGRVLLFGMTSAPLTQSYRDPAAEDRWRVGFGIIWLLGE